MLVWFLNVFSLRLMENGFLVEELRVAKLCFCTELAFFFLVEKDKEDELI